MMYLERPGCNLCMGNQEKAEKGDTVMATSTRLFQGRSGGGQRREEGRVPPGFDAGGGALHHPRAHPEHVGVHRCRRGHCPYMVFGPWGAISGAASVGAGPLGGAHGRRAPVGGLRLLQRRSHEVMVDMASSSPSVSASRCLATSRPASGSSKRQGWASSPYGTVVQGRWAAVFGAIERCHRVVHEMGAPRITTTLKVGTRVVGRRPWPTRSPACRTG